MLTELRVAKPCPESWKGMTGDERVRFCDHCKLNVYNVSEMSENDALRLIQEKEGRVCVRYYQREDGRIMTKDCKVGVAAARIKLAKATAFACGVLVSGFGFDFARSVPQTTDDGRGRMEEFRDRMVDKGRSTPVIGDLIDKIDPPAYAGAIAPMPVPPPVAGP